MQYDANTEPAFHVVEAEKEARKKKKHYTYEYFVNSKPKNRIEQVCTIKTVVEKVLWNSCLYLL